MKERLKSMGSDMLGNSIGAGADGLMRLLEGLPRRREARKPPADAPDVAAARAAAARRPTAEERKEAPRAASARTAGEEGPATHAAGWTAGMSLGGNRREDATAGTPSPRMQSRV